MMVRRAAFIAALCALAATAVHADFSGSTELALSGPGTVRASLDYKGPLQDSLQMGLAEANTAQLFFERGSIVTGSDLVLTKGGTVSVGTSVNSYILHFDPVGSSSSPVWEFHETITFDETVLGVIFDTTASHGQMANSDVTVGLGSGYYETNWMHRKFEEGQDKWNDVAIVGNSVTFNLFTNSSMDEVRIITTPVPGAVLLGLLGLSAAGIKLRKRA
jgi:hypothetical protein